MLFQYVLFGKKSKFRHSLFPGIEWFLSYRVVFTAMSLGSPLSVSLFVNFPFLFIGEDIFQKSKSSG